MTAQVLRLFCFYPELAVIGSVPLISLRLSKIRNILGRFLAKAV
jgi:hypothetical protein